jgi:DNA topoisomerase-3
VEQRIALEWERVRCFDKEVANMFLQEVKSQAAAARVTSVTTKEKQKERPIALNTVELMRIASSGLGMSPHHAMTVAEKLYTQVRNKSLSDTGPTVGASYCTVHGLRTVQCTVGR